MERYEGRRERKVKKLLEKGPFFLDAIKDLKRPNEVMFTLRNMKSKGKDVLMFRHSKGRKHNKSLLPFFILVFKSTQRVEAWNMLLKKFPQINQLGDKWINMGAPILDGLVGRTKGDIKCIRKEECARCGGRIALNYSSDFKRDLCASCEREIRGI